MAISGSHIWAGVARSRLGTEVPNLHQKALIAQDLPGIAYMLHNIHVTGTGGLIISTVLGGSSSGSTERFYLQEYAQIAVIIFKILCLLCEKHL